MKMSQTSGKMSGPDAAIQMQVEFRHTARRMRPRDEHTQDDLVQEMSKAVAECTEPNLQCYFRQLAHNRAKNYLRDWFRKSPVDRAAYEASRRREGRFECFDEGPVEQEKYLENLGRQMEFNAPNAEELIEWLKRSA